MKRKSIAAAVLFLLILNTALMAQPAGKDSAFWNWTPKAAHHESLVKVFTPNGSGTGVVVAVDYSKPGKEGGYEGYVVTARHVVFRSATSPMVEPGIKVSYRNGRRTKGVIVVQDDIDNDVALLWVWIPPGIKAAPLATERIKFGDKLEYCGLGGGLDIVTDLRHFSATASPPCSETRIFSDAVVIPGDSGGGVFNEHGQLVGVVSGGFLWFDGDVKTNKDQDIKASWPARGPNLGSILDLLSEQSKVSKPSADK